MRAKESDVLVEATCTGLLLLIWTIVLIRVKFRVFRSQKSPKSCGKSHWRYSTSTTRASFIAIWNWAIYCSTMSELPSLVILASPCTTRRRNRATFVARRTSSRPKYSMTRSTSRQVTCGPLVSIFWRQSDYTFRLCHVHTAFGEAGVWIHQHEGHLQAHRQIGV